MALTNSNRFRCVGILVLPLLAAGCSVGPDYHPQQARVPESWPIIARSFSIPTPATPAVPSTPTAPAPGFALPGPSSATVPAPTPNIEVAKATSSSENLGQWWTVFNDPVLSKLVCDAMSNNLTLKAAEMRIYQARATRGVVASNLFPQINSDADMTTSRSPVTAPKRGNIGRTVNAFRGGLDATWELDFFGGTRRSIESADANIDAAVEDRRNAMVILAGDVGANYVSLRGFQKQLAIARENVDSQQKSADLIEKKFRAGLTNKLDFANATALVASTRAQIPLLETAVQQASYAIAVLLGRDPAALDDELNKIAPIPPPPPVIPVGLPSDLLRRRPDIRLAEARIHAATANIGVAKADYFPKFSLIGSAGFDGRKPSAFTAWSQRFYSFGPSVTWPIFAAGKIKCNLELQKSIESEIEINFQQTVLVALQDVDSALFALSKEREHHEALAEAVQSYREVVALATKLYTDGNSDYLNVISAQRSLYLAQDALAQSERDMSLDVVALYKALGGGWCEPDVIELSPSVPATANK